MIAETPSALGADPKAIGTSKVSMLLTMDLSSFGDSTTVSMLLTLNDGIPKPRPVALR